MASSSPRVRSLWPNQPSLVAVFGPTRSGKSYLAIKSLFNSGASSLAHRYTVVGLLSPTAAMDDTWRRFCKYTYLQDDISPPAVEQFVADMIEAQRRFREKDPKAQSLIIVDDCLGSISPSSSLIRLCSRYRHHRLSIVWLSQLYRDFKPVVRVSADCIVLFGTYNTKEAGKIVEEYGGSFPDFERLYADNTKERHSYIVVDQKNRQIRDQKGRIISDPNSAQSLPPSSALSGVDA